MHFRHDLHLSAKHQVHPPAKDGLQDSDDQKRDVTSTLPETSSHQPDEYPAYERKHNKADDMITVMDRMTTLYIRGCKVPRQPDRKEE